MEEKILFDEEDRRVILSEMISQLLEDQAIIMERMLDLRLELSKIQQRIELLRVLNGRST